MAKLERRNFAFITTIVVLGTFAFANSEANAQSGLEFPYQALVLREGAKVHSGPGLVHYGTAELKQGEVVQVYQHDPGGWCAIRPPADSFSLVPEATLEIVGDGVARNKEAGTQVWVGTKLGPVDKPLWQVKLKPGQTVEVIGKTGWPHPEGHSTIWYQIAPPAGEFRWIKMSDIQLPVSVRMEMQKKLTKPAAPQLTNQLVRSLNDLPPVTAQTQNAAVQNTAVQQASLQIDLSPPQSQNQQAAKTPGNSGWRQSTRPIANRALSNSSNSLTANPGGNNNNSGQYANANDRNENGQSGMSANSSPRNSNFASNSYGSRFGKSPDQRYGSESQPAKVPANRVADARLSSANLAQGLNGARAGMGIPQSSGIVGSKMSGLEFKLTREMTKEPTEWRLDDLELGATDVFRTSMDASERSEANRFLTKIENCRKVQSGYVSGFGSTGSSFGSTNTSTVDTGVQRDIALGTSYDAHGWLNQLVRDGGQSKPEYVLQDANGKVTHHVAGIQGMNLHRYLKSHVGIIGKRGFHNRLKLAHVTAHQVVELEKKRR